MLADTRLSMIKMSEIIFKTDDASHFYAFAGREGAVGGRP